MSEWIYTVHIADIRQDDALNFKEKRDGIVQRLRYSNWRKLTPDPEVLDRVLNILGFTENAEQFDLVAEDVFDLADRDGVWIEREGVVIKP